MLTFLEMKNQVSDRINKSDSTYLTKIGKWLNFRYDDILGRFDWPQMSRTVTISVAVGDATINLPRDIDLIISLQDRTNDICLTPLNPSAGGRKYVSVIDVNGLSQTYWWEGVSVLAQPTTASTIDVVSSSASDTTQYVRIWGTDSNGAEVTESVLLTGTTAVTSTLTYARVDRVSKDGNTVGLVTGTDGTSTLFKIDPYSYGATNNVIRLLQPSATALSIECVYKFKVPRLINDEDTPVFDCSHAIVLGGYIDALRQQRQHSKAKILEYNQAEPYDPSTYEGKVRSLIQEFDQQAENVPLMWPAVATCPEDNIFRYRI